MSVIPSSQGDSLQPRKVIIRLENSIDQIADRVGILHLNGFVIRNRSNKSLAVNFEWCVLISKFPAYRQMFHKAIVLEKKGLTSM